VATLAPTEIKALARILDELDYYQLLHIEPGASASAVKHAFYASSRAFHADADRQLDADLRAALEKISKRIREAYAVLRDPRLRPAYDRHRREGGGGRMQLAEAESQAGRHAAEQREGCTPQGRQYFNLAQADLRRGDLGGAVRNLQTALTFEPANARFRDQIAELKRKLR
jgi:DnaJ-class molecular chaperone